MTSVATRALSVWLRVFMKPRVATAERARARMARPKGDPEPPASLRRRHLVTVRTVEGFPCYTVTPRSATAPAKGLVYLHGGAYVSEIARAHWRFISRLADAGCQAEVPIYGLAPQHTYRDAFPAITVVHRALLDQFIPVRLTEADGAFHVYPLAPVPEARTAVESIVHAVAEPAPTR